MKRALGLLIAGTLVSGVAAWNASAADVPATVTLTRLDCGAMEVSDFGAFSDAHRYDGQKRSVVDSCYLIRHGDDYLLWDTGLSAKMLGKGVTEGIFTMRVDRTIVAQLAQLGVKPEAVRYVAVSHYHDDHTGQVGDFPGSTLLIGAEDMAVVRTATPAQLDVGGFRSWIDGKSKVETVGRDRDIFGDGSVVMLAMSGHTPGHHSLLVRLKNKGAVLLTGDLYHATESMTHDEVPVFNTNRADTLAAFDRFKKIAANLKATVIIQHEPADVAKLPVFPAAAD